MRLLSTVLILLIGFCMSCKCEIHPNYKGKYKPRNDCESCWAYYREKHSDKVENVPTIFVQEEEEVPDTTEHIEEGSADIWSMNDEPDASFEDLERVMEINFMVDYMREHNHFSKKHFKNGIAPLEEMPDGLDYDPKRGIATEEYLERIAGYFYDASKEEWKEGMKVPYLIAFFLAEPESGYRLWRRGDKTKKHPHGAAHHLLQFRIEWHKKRMWSNGKPGELVHEVTDKNGNPVRLNWMDDYDMIRYFYWHVSTSMSQGMSLKKALSPWPNTRPKALKNYNLHKD